MVRKFEAAGMLGIQPGRVRKSVAEQIVNDEATQLKEDRSQTIGSTSVRRTAASVNQPCSSVYKILQKIFRYCQCKLWLVQQLLSSDLDSQQTFVLQFLKRVQLQDEWPWNILCTNKFHFPMEGAFNTDNCRIWAATNPHQFLQTLLRSSHVTFLMRIYCIFNYWSVFFEELSAAGPVTCKAIGQQCASLFKKSVIIQDKAMR